MKTVRLSKNFWLHEYMPEQLYREYEQKNELYKLVWLLDDRLIVIDQFLRDRFGLTTINNWLAGGDRQWSGLRIPDKPYYYLTTQHAHGRASDKVYRDVTAEEVIQDVRDNWEELYKPIGLTELEIRATWVHTGCRNSDKLITFEP